MGAGRELSELDTLPPVPQAARDIIALLNAPEVEAGRLAAAISREPGLTGRIVASANAAFFSGQRPIYTVDDAVVRLGLGRVRLITVSMLLGRALDPRACPRFNIRQYWFESLKSGNCAARLAGYTELETPVPAAYLCGLLARIGRLAQAVSFPAETEWVLERLEREPELSRTALEREVVGFDHHAAGAELLRRWDMPSPVVECIGALGDDPYTGSAPQLHALVRMAVDWADDDFQSLPATGLAEAFEPTRLEAVGRNCLREREQMESFAFMLCSAA